MKPERSRLLFFEGAQGAGKTSAVKTLGESGAKCSRGIPQGEVLSKNSESENWLESLKNIIHCRDEGGLFVIDRSIWSLVAYNMRKKPEQAELIFRLGSSFFSRYINEEEYLIVIIDVDTDISIKRENKDGLKSRKNTSEAVAEIKTYRDLATRLTNEGFKVLVLNNNEDNLDLFAQKLRSLL